MLTRWKRNQAVEIAQILAVEGMLFGQELEEYIELEEMDWLVKLKNDEKDEFIDEVIKSVEKQWKKAIAVYDKKERITKIFLTAEDAAKEINTSLSGIYTSKRINSCVNNRYILSIYKPNINELSLGLKSIASNPRKGYFLKI